MRSSSCAYFVYDSYYTFLKREIERWFIVVVLCNFPACKTSLTTLSRRVWLPDVVDPLESMFLPELSIPRDSGPHPRPGIASRRTGVPFPFLPDGMPDLPLSEPEEQQGVLNVGLSVQCEDTKMVVSIDKESLQVSGQDHVVHNRSCSVQSSD